MYRQLEKNLLNSNMSSTCPYNMVNFGTLTAEIGWRVWSTQQISTGFALLQRRRSLEANQTLHDVWPSPGLLPLTGFCQMQNSPCVQVLRSPILV